jgi:hypothetical protein
VSPLPFADPLSIGEAPHHFESHPIRMGFYPCNSEGKQVKPAADEWTTNCYVCGRCERIINMVQ